jgi:N-acetylglucosaminyl-diphospho-decaprenol L-rhamnosyltransferase
MDALPLPPTAADLTDISVVVVNYNTAHLLGEFFAALDASRGPLKLQVIVIDNASSDGSVDVLRAKHPNVELIVNQVNVGFGRANNQALPRIRGRYVLLLNTDAFVAPDTLRNTVEFMDWHPRCGVLGVKLVGRDGTLQPSCRYFPTPWNLFLAKTGFHRFFPGTRLVDDMSWDHASVRECDWVPGCYYLVRREVIEHVGLFDPRYFLYCEELDHCRAVHSAGWSVLYYPFTQVVHLAGESAKSEGPLTHSRQIPAQQIESELLYFRKHYGRTGLLFALISGLLGNTIVACKAFMLHLDIKETTAAANHTWTMLRILAMTRLASRATR